MAKLKLGAIEDDKPVKLTVELSAAVHRDLMAYSEVLGRENRTSRNRAHKADRPDDRSIHGDRSDICKGTSLNWQS
jgi:hypothetical protein